MSMKIPYNENMLKKTTPNQFRSNICLSCAYRIHICAGVKPRSWLPSFISTLMENAWLKKNKNHCQTSLPDSPYLLTTLVTVRDYHT